MRTLLWNNLFATKYHQLFARRCAKISRDWGLAYSIFFSVVSASSVATWAAWQQYPGLWAIIVAISQVLHIIKPFIPFLGHEKQYLEMSFEYGCLHLEYEKLWGELEEGKIKESDVRPSVLQLQRRMLDFENGYKGVYYGKPKGRENIVYQETVVALSLNHPTLHEEKEKI